MTANTDQQRIAELPPKPDAFDVWHETDDDCGAWARPSRPVYDGKQMDAYALAAQDKYAAPLIERIAELERMHGELLLHYHTTQHEAARLEKQNAELQARIARLTNPQHLVHRGNSISLNCKRSTIDLFVSRAIANKDTPNPTPEQVAEFWKAVDAALTQREEDDEPCSFCHVRGCNGECSGDGGMGG